MTGEAKNDILAESVVLGGGSCGDLLEKGAALPDGDLGKPGQEASSEKIRGDTAVVTLEGAPDPIHLRKVDGEWLVDSFALKASLPSLLVGVLEGSEETPHATTATRRASTPSSSVPVPARTKVSRSPS
jgi:hypothetical protein